MRHFSKRVPRLVIRMMALFALAGCGQAGPLYLQDAEPVATPAGRAGPASPPAPATAVPTPTATPQTP